MRPSLMSPGAVDWRMKTAGTGRQRSVVRVAKRLRVDVMGGVGAYHPHRAHSRQL